MKFMLNENKDIIIPSTGKIIFKHTDLENIVEYMNSQDEIISGFCNFQGLTDSEKHLNFIYNKLADMIISSEKEKLKWKELERFDKAYMYHLRELILMEIQGLLINGENFEEDIL